MSFSSQCWKRAGTRRIPASMTVGSTWREEVPRWVEKGGGWAEGTEKEEEWRGSEEVRRTSNALFSAIHSGTIPCTPGRLATYPDGSTSSAAAVVLLQLQQEGEEVQELVERSRERSSSPVREWEPTLEPGQSVMMTFYCRIGDDPLRVEVVVELRRTQRSHPQSACSSVIPPLRPLTSDRECCACYFCYYCCYPQPSPRQQLLLLLHRATGALWSSGIRPRPSASPVLGLPSFADVDEARGRAGGREGEREGGRGRKRARARAGTPSPPAVCAEVASVILTVYAP